MFLHEPGAGAALFVQVLNATLTTSSLMRFLSSFPFVPLVTKGARQERGKITRSRTLFKAQRPYPRTSFSVRGLCVTPACHHVSCGFPPSVSYATVARTAEVAFGDAVTYTWAEVTSYGGTFVGNTILFSISCSDNGSTSVSKCSEPIPPCLCGCEICHRWLVFCGSCHHLGDSPLRHSNVFRDGCHGSEFQGSQSKGRVSLAVVWQENLSLYIPNLAVIDSPTSGIQERGLPLASQTFVEA